MFLQISCWSEVQTVVDQGQMTNDFLSHCLSHTYANHDEEQIVNGILNKKEIKDKSHIILSYNIYIQGYAS